VVGKPGTMAKPHNIAEALNKAFALVDSCAAISMPSERGRLCSSATRVIKIPAATEISSDGICETIASPMESTEKRLAASPALMPW